MTLGQLAAENHVFSTGTYSSYGLFGVTDPGQTKHDLLQTTTGVCPNVLLKIHKIDLCARTSLWSQHPMNMSTQCKIKASYTANVNCGDCVVETESAFFHS